MRFDNRHVDSKAMTVDGEAKFNQFTRNFSNVSGSAGLSFEASKEVTWKFNLARGFRAPTLAELASNGAHEGTIRYEVGDNNLKSETSLQVDGGVEINSEHVSIDASLFYNHINNFIFYEKVLTNTGADSIIVNPETGEDLTVFRFDQKNTNLYGAEISMDIHPHPLDWLHIKNTFSYTRGQFTEAIDNSKNIPFMPAARLFSELGVNFLQKGKIIRNGYVDIESDYTFKQNHPFTGYNTETGTSSYWLINSGIGADVVSKEGKKLFSIYISGMNLTNIAYQSFLSRLRYEAVNNVTGRVGVFDMGRNFSFKVNVPLDYKLKGK
jgi:iron complex outermembrane receptor protein